MQVTAKLGHFERSRIGFAMTIIIATDIAAVEVESTTDGADRGTCFSLYFAMPKKITA